MNTTTLHPQAPANAEAYTCLDFRRDKLAQPKHLSQTAHQHQRECALCQAFARRADMADARINQALTHIDIPDGLNERILLRSLGKQHRPWRPLALAASFVLAAFLGFNLWQGESAVPTGDLALAAVLHQRTEAAELALHQSEKPSQFPIIMASFGGHVQAPIGEIDYIHFCPIDGFGQGWHIVYNTPQGKVTLLLVPAKAGAAKVETVQIEGKSIKVERAGKGYYAIITDSAKHLDEADQLIQKRVRWDT